MACTDPLSALITTCSQSAHCHIWNEIPGNQHFAKKVNSSALRHSRQFSARQFSAKMPRKRLRSSDSNPLQQAPRRKSARINGMKNEKQESPRHRKTSPHQSARRRSDQMSEPQNEFVDECLLVKSHKKKKLKKKKEKKKKKKKKKKKNDSR